MVTASWFSRFGPSFAVCSSKVLCRRLTSYCASNPIASALVTRGTHNKISRGKTLLFHRAMPDLLLCASGRGSGYLSNARLPSHNSLTIRFLFVIAMLCHPLPSDSTSRWTPLLRLAVPPRRGLQRTCTSWINAMPGAHKKMPAKRGLGENFATVILAFTVANPGISYSLRIARWIR